MKKYSIFLCILLLVLSFHGQSSAINLDDPTWTFEGYEPDGVWKEFWMNADGGDPGAGEPGNIIWGKDKSPGPWYILNDLELEEVFGATYFDGQTGVHGNYWLYETSYVDGRLKIWNTLWEVLYDPSNPDSSIPPSSPPTKRKKYNFEVDATVMSYHYEDGFMSSEILITGNLKNHEKWLIEATAEIEFDLNEIYESGMLVGYEPVVGEDDDGASFVGGSLRNVYVDIWDPPIPGGPPAVPEPATMLLLGSGLIGLAGFRKRFRKR